MSNDTAGQTIELRMFFTGLMVFAVQDKEVHALVVDARDPAKHKIQGIEPHRSVIQFSWPDALGDLRPFGSFTDFFGEKKGYWLLDKDIVYLDPQLATEEADLSFDTGNVQGTTPVEANQDSIDWMAPLGGNGRAARLKPGLTSPNRQNAAAELLAASVQLKRGRVQTAAFASEITHYVISDFANGSRRAFMSVVEHRVRVKGRSVRLQARKFDGSEGEVLELLPARNGSQPTVEVWVLNRGWDAIEKQVPSRPVSNGTPNPEYLFFHMLLADDPGAQALPRPADRNRGTLPPNIRPCMDLGMRRLYFPDGGGQSANAAPCSPAVIIQTPPPQ